MKKLFRTILVALIACVSLICLFGCGGNAKVEGKYLFESASGQAGGPSVSIKEQDENGVYVNVVDGYFNPENFWVEIKGKTLTIHGLIDPVGGSGLKFSVLDSERKIENFKLQTSTVNEAWYAVIDSKGEDTLWQILKDGKQITFQYGKPGPELYYSISYKKA